MLVNAPAMSAGSAGNTGVTTPGATNDGVFGDRTGDFGGRGGGGALGNVCGFAARWFFAFTSGLPPRSRTGELGERAPGGDGAFGGAESSIGAGDGS